MNKAVENKGTVRECDFRKWVNVIGYNDILLVSDKNGNWGAAKRDGCYIVEPQYTKIVRIDDYLKVEDERGNIRVFDLEGRELLTVSAYALAHFGENKVSDLLQRESMAV